MDTKIISLRSPHLILAGIGALERLGQEAKAPLSLKPLSRNPCLRERVFMNMYWETFLWEGWGNRKISPGQSSTWRRRRPIW